ncbi:hypothetical protein BCR35DRAFT_348207 [Leucosporidium creatinivorum]|uniref:Uncharacterized protein n=1 Tax=Leucosporidium creatinivorum TaxID=106004 RepID=A0A1Y2FZL2_9BASI|nr:hypothetical protein BCR35DRAFT_348207 [Leucosporidium creatinivorum]
MGSVQPSLASQGVSPKLTASSNPSTSTTPADLNAQLKKLQQANERYKFEAREATRNSRIAQRKLDAANEEKEEAIRKAMSDKDAAHRQEMQSLQEKLFKEHVNKMQEENDHEEEADAAEVAEEAYLMERARLESEITALRSESEKVQLAHHACKDQRDQALSQLSKQQEKTKRVEESLKKAEEEHRREKAASAGKLEVARKELGTEREKRIKLREERDELKEESREAQAQLKEELCKANEEVSRAQGLLAAPHEGDTASSSNAEIVRLRRELHSALASIQRLKPLELELKKSYKRLEPANHQIRKLEEALRTLEKKHETVDRDLGIKTNEIFLVQTTAEEKVRAEFAAVVAGLKEELSHVADDLKLSRGQASLLEKELTESKAERAFAEEALHAKNKEISELRTDNEILQDQVRSHSTKLQQAIELSARHSALAKKLSLAEEGARSLEEELAIAGEKMESQQKELETWQNRALELETQLQDTHFPAVGSSAPHPLQSMVVQELRSTVEDLRSRLEEEKEHLVTALGSQDERAQEFNAQKQALLDTCNKLEAEVKQLELQRKTSTALISTLRTKLIESEENVGRLQQGFAAVQELMGRHGAEREQDRSSIIALQHTIVQLERDKILLAENLEAEQQRSLAAETERAAVVVGQGLGIGLVSPPESPPQSRDWKQVNGEVDNLSDSQAIDASLLFAPDSPPVFKGNFSNRTLLNTLSRLNAQVTALQQANAEERMSNERLLERLVELEGSQIARSASA